jgi:hypothetical protein
MTLTVSPSTDYLVSYGLNMLHYYLRKYYLIIKFYQTNSQNTWDATGHCFRLTLNKNETKTVQNPYIQCCQNYQLTNPYSQLQKSLHVPDYARFAIMIQIKMHCLISHLHIYLLKSKNTNSLKNKTKIQKKKKKI